MLIFSDATRRAVVGGIGAAATAGAVLFGAAPAAMADPPPPPPPAPAPAPPNCTAADLAGVSAGVAASTSTYLFTHPDVNAYFTSLKGQPRDSIRSQVQDYLNANPQVQSDLQGIRQPLVDLQNRCQ
ncbi:heme-binding protein [Mycobacterium sp.]|uniref:heme-binding protein n=1 Tax=Mycobacterium sp. TaxID=1785 RepID=UPI002BEFADA3|nr:heme-binding protein [Mycobacterium sp.]HME47792.1 heme-binding protein [Mycobacterium sp.]